MNQDKKTLERVAIATLLQEVLNTLDEEGLTPEAWRKLRGLKQQPSDLRVTEFVE